jgi:CHAD domain-containing protein
MRAIHRTRVESRRLRELLPVLQLEPGRARKLSRRLRKVTRKLGKRRELDVLVTVAEGLHESRHGGTPFLDDVVKNLHGHRDQIWDKRLAKHAAVDLDKAMKALAALSEDLKGTKPRSKQIKASQWAIEARVARRAEALRAAIDRAGAVYFPERLHLVRIALKKLRYGAELAVQAQPIASQDDLAILTRVQNLLGRLHDLQVFIDHLRRFQTGTTAPDLSRWRELDGLMLTLERSCRRLHARYVHERPALMLLCEKLAARSSAPSRRAAKAS